MKVMFLSGLLAAAALFVGASVQPRVQPDEPIVPGPGDPAPGFEGDWLNHDDTSLAELGGKVVLIEFWRTW